MTLFGICCCEQIKNKSTSDNVCVYVLKTHVLLYAYIYRYRYIVDEYIKGREQSRKQLMNNVSSVFLFVRKTVPGSNHTN